jgi:replication-associated recombination protein RarA
MAKGYQIRTENGYDFFEVASALQKCIRRGLEEEAVYWAFELDSKYSDFLWKRLTVISNEDIGLADPQVVVLIETMRQQSYLLRGSPGDRRLIATNAVVALCRAKKTRLGDDMAVALNRRRVCENWRIEIPDYALDRHTRRGSAMGREWDHWAEHGCKLSNEAKGMNTYFEEATKLRKKHGRLREKKNIKQSDPNAPLDLFEENQ